MENLIIRKALHKDFKDISDLCNQLGYQTESKDIPQRLEQINDLNSHVIFVAEFDNQVIGWIHVYICPLLVSPLQAQLGGLVVNANQRSKGVGTRLLQHAEAWSHSNACQYLSIFTNITRTETHKFYTHLGYKNIKTEHLLRKEI